MQTVKMSVPGVVVETANPVGAGAMPSLNQPMTVASPKPIPNATHRVQQRAGKDRITWRRDERTEGHIDGHLANGTLVIAKRCSVKHMSHATWHGGSGYVVYANLQPLGAAQAVDAQALTVLREHLKTPMGSHT